MKRKAWLLAAAVCLTLNYGMTAMAADPADLTVSYTAGEEMSYGDSKGLTDAFNGMAPGETRTATIKLENDSDHAADFLISQETIKALEDDSKASGGAYEYDLTYKDQNGKEVSLMTDIAGGADSGDNKGLKEIDELKDYTMISRIEKGKSTDVYLKLKLDGEGTDNTYQATNGVMNFNFMASYVDDAGKIITVKTPVNKKLPPVVVQGATDEIVPVQTSDSNIIWIGLGILAAGVVLIVIGTRKRKAGDKQ
jgi:hypothetical protein